MNKQEVLALVRLLINLGQKREEAINNSAVPPEFRKLIHEELEREDNIILEPARFITRGAANDWLQGIDRSKWYYWPTLRSYILSTGWSTPSVQSLDETTDRIIRQLPMSTSPQFEIKGLVLGYVQSGKTSNYTALMAKAADNGYRMFIVLSGIDKGLRRQTQMRLERELMGLSSTENGHKHVPIPPSGLQWHSFTSNDIDGDFRPGTANQASLQGPEPVLMVIKKNGAVLRRLIGWLSGAPNDVMREIPALIIDDEADLASIDTRGTYQADDEPPGEDYEPPSIINGLIRQLLSLFMKNVYVAYTATPFANVLIPHDTTDPSVGNDLYPSDFVVDLPKPHGYFGPEELFGIANPITGEQREGLDIIRYVPGSDIPRLEEGKVPGSLEKAILSYVLSGAARAHRGQAEEPSTMLVHTSFLIESHGSVSELIRSKFQEIRDAWRYDRAMIEPTLRELWNAEFIPVTREVNAASLVSFDEIECFVGPFLEAVQIRTINSRTGDVLDYSRETGLKTIVIGGNRLSRGLTLEGLTVSYFVRESPTYDTLMQMGRWFGYREGYVDLTRIWTTPQLAGWFADLAFVEHRLRDDIRVYEDMQITPQELGIRIWQHPSMQVTSPLKRRYATSILLEQSYSGQLEQTFKFPFDRPAELAVQQDANIRLLMRMLEEIGSPTWENNIPTWTNVSGDTVLGFLRDFKQSEAPERSGCSLPLICQYIDNQMGENELNNWTISVRGLQELDSELGRTTWEVQGRSIYQISRTRLRGTNSLGVITSPGDERVGLSDDEVAKFNNILSESPNMAENVAARRARSAQNGLLLIYPVSRRSVPKSKIQTRRQPIFEGIDEMYHRDIIALAISFPSSSNIQPVQAYLQGTVGWRPYNEIT